MDKAILPNAEPITSSNEPVAEQASKDILDKSVEAEIALGRLHTDPVSPALAEPKEEVADQSADDEPKVLLTLEVANIPNNAANGKIEVKEADFAQMESPHVKTSMTEIVETVQISNADSSNEVTSGDVFLHNSRFQKSQNPVGEESFEVVEVIGMPTDSKKGSTSSETNPLADVTNDELIAILEGDADSTVKAERPEESVAETIVFEVIEEDGGQQKTLNAEEVKKIALEQMRSMGSKRRGRPPAASKQDGGSLVSSLVSDWSDNEKDSEPAVQTPKTAPQVANKPSTSPAKKQPPASPEKKIILIKKKAVAKEDVKKVVPTVASMKPSRIIKKKIIWDPDAPETQISYASLVKPASAGKKRKPAAVTPTQPAQKRKVDQTPTTAEKPKPATQTATDAKSKVETTKTKAAQEPVSKSKPIQATIPSSMQPKVRIPNKLKRTTPSPTIALQNKRKRVSEIDRLLNDEGAANMLNTLDSEKPVQKDSRARKTPTPAPVQTEKTPKKETTPKKRPGRQSASSSWDYVYNQRNVDSMIIRRRSNSSYSSTTSPRRVSLDLKPVRGAKAKSKSFEFAKPEMKKPGKRSADSISETLIADDIKNTSPQETMRKSARTPVSSEQKDSQIKSTAKPADTLSPKEERNTPEVAIKRHGNIVQIILKPKMDKVRNTFSVQLMNEVVRQLDALQSDSACKVLVITSVGPSFCQGVDFLALTQGNADKRKTATLELAGSVTSFLKALVTFPKPLIAGVIGSCSGIGVTMLPAFDAVVSSDKSTFETAYAKIGQIPEGNCLLTSTTNVRHSFKVKLLWLCEKLTSTEAALSGLVTKLTAPSKVVEDTMQCARRIASLSQQSLLAIKAQRSDIKKLITTLNEEQKILVNQWQTPECQEKFKQYIAKESW